MIIKAQGSDGSFMLFDNVRDVRFTDINKFYPSPPYGMTTNFNDFKNWVEKIASSEKIEYRTDDGFKPFDQFLGLNVDDLPDDQKILFLGSVPIAPNEIRPDEPIHEKYCFKIVSFVRGNCEYILYTEHRVYICSDTGKTIEIVNK